MSLAVAIARNGARPQNLMEVSPMFRHLSTAALMLLAVGSLATVRGEEPKEAGGKKQITNSLGMTLIYCPSGSFTMGSPAAEKSRFDNEAQVSVTISRGFYLGKTSVTQAEFKAVMGATPWAGEEYVKEGDDYPATFVDWNDAAEFCRKLTARESKAGRLPQGYVYALPTEAQREYACRAGTTTAYSFGNDPRALGDYAWWGGMVRDGNCETEQYAHRVGQKKPNSWGFCDLHGNVGEWCHDYYAKKLLGGMDPHVASGADRVIRGGSWDISARSCRSTFRVSCDPRDLCAVLGFRVAMVLSDKISAAEPTPDPTKQITNSIGMKLALIPSGEFMMGSKESAEETAKFLNKTYGGDFFIWIGAIADGKIDRLRPAVIARCLDQVARAVENISAIARDINLRDGES
jgi:formylglycine-generating enzyme required for sulfatase activity